MKILIVEDERLAQERLKQMILKIRPEWEILEPIEGVRPATAWLSSHPMPDLILMDIQLEDGVSFEIFEQIQVDAPVIFTTAYDEYAIKAFKVNSIDYLLKPINIDALEQAFVKFERVTSQNHTNNIPAIEQAFTQIGKKWKSRFLVRVGQSYMPISVSDIELFYVSERSVFMRTAQSKTYDLDYSLDQLQQLVDPELFFRISRNYLIHINAVAKMVSYSSSRMKIILASGNFPEDLIVSREKVSEFKKWIDR